MVYRYTDNCQLSIESLTDRETARLTLTDRDFNIYKRTDTSNGETCGDEEHTGGGSNGGVSSGGGNNGGSNSIGGANDGQEMKGATNGMGE